MIFFLKNSNELVCASNKTVDNLISTEQDLLKKIVELDHIGNLKIGERLN